MSQPVKSNWSRSLVVRVLSPKLTSVPSERRLASAAISSTGNWRSAARGTHDDDLVAHEGLL